MSPQQSIAHYRIVSKLGEGGMGAVYRATDTKLGRDVAIKVLPPAFAQDAGRMHRFEREAQVLAALNHPNIAAIYGIEQGAIVMELVEGEDLKGPLPADTAIGYAKQLAAALEAAHEKGIVHRDLKPANMKITSEGVLKVLDFGLAKAAEEGPPSGAASPTISPTVSLEMTQTGTILGTAAYMSPEQARGKPVDKRADIWAFGAVLYEMLSGRRAFEGETVSDTLAAVLRGDIDWSRLPRTTPPSIRRLLQRCLERDPKLRLRDIGDAWIELDAPADAAVPVAPRPHRAVWLLAALIPAAVLAGWLLHQPQALPRPVTRWTLPNDESVVAVSHDGTHLAYTRAGSQSDSPSVLMVRKMDELTGTVISETEGARFAFFSPDGRWIAFTDLPNGQIVKAPVTGGSPIPICEGNAIGGGAAWGEGGDIVFSGPNGLERVSDRGGTPQPLTTLNPKNHERRHSAPQFLPGGGAILFTVDTGGSRDEARVAVLDLATHTQRVLVENAFSGRYVPTGHLLFKRGQKLFAAPFDANRLLVKGPEVQVLDNVDRFAFSDFGLFFYLQRPPPSAPSPGSTLEWRDRQGGASPLAPAHVWMEASVSPDGKQIAASISETARKSGIWIFDVNRQSLTRITPDERANSPVWTPDGKRIVYNSRREGKPGIYWVPADGSGPEELLMAGEDLYPWSWSPDGKTLLYTRIDTPYAVEIAGGAQVSPPRQVAEGRGLQGLKVSPDGHWVAYSQFDSSGPQVFVQAFPGPGPKVQVSSEGGIQPVWAPDGRELFYMQRKGFSYGPTDECPLMAVDVQTASGFHAGRPHALFAVNPGGNLDIAPDGKHFMVERFAPLKTGTGKAEWHMVTDWFEELRRLVPSGR